jgi:hypothetical protein
MTRADFPESLRSLLRRDEDLRSRCLQASVAQGLFGSADTVELAGRQFSVLRRLGAGSMGVVYEVERAGHSGRLALKLLHLAGGDQAYRLKREFRTLSRLGHPNLVTLHELYSDADGCAFTMELVRGSEFLPYVRPGGQLDLARLRDVLAQLADGLGFLHEQGVVHRDLKPSNLLIDASGRAVLLDFGVALVGPELDVSGTARYMAPEQRSGHSVPASDLYALGVMLEQALPPPPTAAESELAFWRELSQRLRSEDPASRPSARELLRELRAGQSAPIALKSTGFVGRDAELLRLREFAADSGRPRLCYVEGPSGQGKSALIAEFARQLDNQAHGWTLVGRCCRRESVRYRALDPLIDALSDALLAADVSMLESLQTYVTAHLLELFPVLERVPLFAQQKHKGVGLADPRERRAAAVTALRRFLAELARHVRLCLCIDDVHWLDPESLSMIRELLHPPDAPALLWLCAGRPPAAADLDALARALPAGDVCRIELSALSPRDAGVLARALWPDRPQLWDWAQQRSGGNPFVLVQLGQLALESEQPGDELAFERMVERRLRALPERARELLALVALSNQPLALEVLCDCAEASRADLEGALHLLEGQRYLRSTLSMPLRVEPYHERIAEFAQALVPEERRPRLHLRIAEALERAPDALDAPALLFHFRRAARVDKALHFGKLAAQRAQERLSFHEAAAFFAECSELVSGADERAELARARAEALINAGRDREAGMILHELSYAASSRSQRFQLVCRAADLFFRAGYRLEAMRLLEPWLRELGLSPRSSRAGQFASFVWHRARCALPAWLTRAGPAQDGERVRERIELCLLTVTGLSRSEILQSLDYAARLVLCVRHGGTIEQRVRTLLIEALLNANVAPRSERAVALVQRAQALSEPVPDPLLHARVSAVAAAVAGLRTDRPGMGQHAQRAVQLFEAHGRGVQMELTEARCMWLIIEFGRGMSMERELLQIIRDAAERGDRFTEAGTRMYLATAMLAAGQPKRMRAEAAGACALIGAGEREGIYWVGAGQQARADLFEGKAQDAYLRLMAALRRMRTHGFLLVPWLRIEIRYLLALGAAQARGRRALAEVRAIARTLERENLPWPRLLSDQLRAWVTGVEGERELAAQQLFVNAAALEGHRGAWYAAGSRWLALQFRGDWDGKGELLRTLRGMGLAEPQRFLAAYAPLLNEATDGHDD